MIYLDQRRFQARQRIRDIDQRLAQGNHSPRKVGVEQMSDDSLRLPFSQRRENLPVRRNIAQNPPSLVEGVGMDSAKDAPTVA
jgi:hypothetical protein